MPIPLSLMVRYSWLLSWYDEISICPFKWLYFMAFDSRFLIMVITMLGSAHIIDSGNTMLEMLMFLLLMFCFNKFIDLSTNIFRRMGTAFTVVELFWWRDHSNRLSNKSMPWCELCKIFTNMPFISSLEYDLKSSSINWTMDICAVKGDFKSWPMMLNNLSFVAMAFV